MHVYVRGWPANIRRILRWLPILWRDRDWDHDYLYRIMAFKLREMSVSMARYGAHVGDDKNARQMRICANALERLTDEKRFLTDNQAHALLAVFCANFRKYSQQWWY